MSEAASSRRFPSRRAGNIKVKREDIINGDIKCPHPDCDSMVASAARGCNLTTCTGQAHAPHFFYFCYHCKKTLANQMPCTDCPSRNNMETRKVAQERRNEKSKNNPVDLSED